MTGPSDRPLTVTDCVAFGPTSITDATNVEGLVTTNSPLASEAGFESVRLMAPSPLTHDTLVAPAIGAAWTTPAKPMNPAAARPAAAMSFEIVTVPARRASASGWR